MTFTPELARAQFSALSQQIDGKPAIFFDGPGGAQVSRGVLEKMTDQYAKTVIKVNEFEDNEYLDYHARRLVEMAGNVIMGYLLLIDANRNNDYTKSADIFIRIARAENIAKVGYINQSHPKDLGTYKQV